LFEQAHVDPGPLRDAVRAALRRSAQATLAEIVAAVPLRQGLAELVAYLALRDDAFTAVFDDTCQERVTWIDADGLGRTATLPRVTFTRAGAAR
jgi:hypothetical protein